MTDRHRKKRLRLAVQFGIFILLTTLIASASISFLTVNMETGNVYRVLLIPLALFLFVLVTGASIFFAHRIISPLKQLTNAAQDTAKETTDISSPIRDADEISDIENSFLQLQDQIRMHQIQIKERTDELAAANEKLQQEINARKTVELQLQHDSLYDALTGLPNRSLFLDRLQHTIMLGKRRTDHLYAVLFLGIDRFKVINDSLGHVVGDELLAAFSRRITFSLRPFDTVARIEGDTFAILLEDIRSQSNATYIAERLGADLTEPFTVNGHEVFVTASIGIALISGKDEHPEQILRNADIAMNKAKGGGRTNYVIFETGMHTRVLERMRLETTLRKAVENKELTAYYQPILSSKTGRVVGFEALVRWLHPERGLVSPAEFIPIAEETGLIVSIDRFMLREACLQMREWHDQLQGSSLRYISVNVSNRQMAQPDLINYVEQVLNETGLEPGCLKLEITENVIIKDPEAIAVMLDRLRAIGVHLYIDDFGTGYSSLSYLHRLPINGFKIDRSFIKRLGTNGENQEIVKTILLLAQDLNVEVIAEGIETDNQLNQMKALSCEYWQGYLASKPVPKEQATHLIESEQAAIVLKKVM